MKKSILILAALTAAVVFASIFYGISNYSRANAKAVFYCVESDEMLFSSKADERIAPASLTKLLAASVALYYIDPDEVFTVGSEQELVPKGSSVCLILPGHRLTLCDLITGMLMASGNDAAYTVAVGTARALDPDASMTDMEAVEKFCGLMNDFAKELGMSNSHFTTPDGSDDDGQYTTVSDLLMLAKYALSVPEICEIAGTYRKYVVFESGENITWTNSNKLLCPESRFYSEYAVGLKTGTTSRAGNCLIAAFKKDGKTYISIAAGCFMDMDRYELTLKNFSVYA
ncbi:MAG: D-alanyl-D-alanine carboxypeptidase [Oscillospiraceae bacterium]|nr:D-alanyl-D-alanine carboxypeptidase [Oscillospiraceae bacterium]